MNRENTTEGKEYSYSFSHCGTHIFVGKKAAAVYFGQERVPVKTWRQVYAVILDRCNQQCHDMLMYLRGRTAGKVRVFLSDKPDKMSKPLKIDENLWAESHYGSYPSPDKIQSAENKPLLSGRISV